MKFLVSLLFAATAASAATITAPAPQSTAENLGLKVIIR